MGVGVTRFVQKGAISSDGEVLPIAKAGFLLK